MHGFKSHSLRQLNNKGATKPESIDNRGFENKNNSIITVLNVILLSSKVGTKAAVVNGVR